MRKRVKVVVVGPGEGGKSTLIRRLAGDGAMNLEVSGRTVAMDHGVLRQGDTQITLIGVPGQPRFAAVREALVIGARAAIWLHPAGQAPDADTVSLLQSAELCDRPYLVFVNTRDGSSPAFIPVASLKPPRGILCGNLIDSRANLEPLHEALADLLANCAWN